jgi:hypothetical protein
VPRCEHFTGAWHFERVECGSLEYSTSVLLLTTRLWVNNVVACTPHALQLNRLNVGSPLVTGVSTSEISPQGLNLMILWSGCIYTSHPEFFLTFIVLIFFLIANSQSQILRKIQKKNEFLAKKKMQ